MVSEPWEQARGALAQGARVAGVDEVGRGPLAGDVVAAAVILDPRQPIQGLDDSKKLSARRREVLAQQVQEQALGRCDWSSVTAGDR